MPTRSAATRDIEIERGVFDGNQKGNPRPEGPSHRTVGYNRGDAPLPQTSADFA